MRVCPQKSVMFWVSLKPVWAWRMRTMHSPQFRQMQQMLLLQTLPPQVCRRTGVTSCTASCNKQVCVTIIGWNASGWINRLFWTYILEDFNQTLQCLLVGPHARSILLLQCRNKIFVLLSGLDSLIICCQVSGQCRWMKLLQIWLPD